MANLEELKKLADEKGVELDGGDTCRYAFTLMPQWTKARWIDGVLQPAKLYLIAKAGMLSESGKK